ADRVRRAHLATCSVLRSCGVQEYASSLRPCARVDLHPPDAIRPLLPSCDEGDLLRSSLRGFLPPPHLALSLLRRAPFFISSTASGGTSEAMWKGAVQMAWLRRRCGGERRG